MFRRKRSSSNPPRPGTTTPSAAAAVAASQAFLAKQTNDAALSASAAAAALRSHTTTPTPVSQVQTKRMQRRASQTSINSAPGRPGLQRRGSSGSMTERSFREPTPVPPNRPPERPASSHGPYPKYDNDVAPPVPALPERYASPPPPRSSKPAPAGTGSKSHPVVSGPTEETRIRPTSSASPSNRSPSSKTEASSVAHLAANQANNRASVNFSRPMSPQNLSSSAPTVSKSLDSQDKGTAALTAKEAKQVANTVQQAATRPVKKKKKAARNLEGQHLQAGLEHTAPVAKDVERSSAPTTNDDGAEQLGLNAPVQGTSPSAGTARKPKKTKVKVPPATTDRDQAGDDAFGTSYPSDSDSVVSDMSSTTDRSRVLGPKAKSSLAKQPSIVREDREGEAMAETSLPRPEHSKISETQQTKTSKSETGVNTMASGVKDQSKDSLIPSKALHFSAEPVYQSPDGTKHQPLGRSASPAKSAMKSSPSRGHSPSLLRTQGLAGDLSDATSGLSDEGTAGGKKKRRNVRVSFDAESVVVGEASTPVRTDSPVLASPQNRSSLRSSFSRGDSASGDAHEGNKDLSIKPTPILPSFGSVRDRKSKDKDVHFGSHEPANKSATADPSGEDLAGASSDQRVGAILANETSSLPSAPVSPKGRESSPHEGNVLASESTLNNLTQPPSGSMDATMPATTQESKSEQISNVAKKQQQDHSQPQVGNEMADSLVPVIAVLPATPAAEDLQKADKAWPGAPGDFPDSKASPSAENSAATPELHTTSSPAASDDASSQSGVVMADEPADTLSSEMNAPVQPSTSAATDDADDDSVYGESAEYQADEDGDEYGSINAIVHSPTATEAGQGSVDKHNAPQPELVNDKPMAVDHDEPVNREKRTEAQTYWSGLSETQKEQLKHAALPGAIDERVVPDRTLRGKGSIAKQPKPKSPNRKDNRQPLGAKATAVDQKGPLSNTQASQVDRGPQTTSAKTVLQKKGRPVAAVPIVDFNQNQPTSFAKGQSTASKAKSSRSTAPSNELSSTKAAKPKLNRTKSDGSDSDSSFKRLRPSKPDNGRYQMRRSMRGVSAGDRTSVATGPSNSQTSAPTTNRRPFSQNGPRGTSMRMSMREPVVDSKPIRKSMRHSADVGSPERTKSPSRLSFLGSKAKKSHGRNSSKTESTYSSRFEDSSDEDSGLPQLRSSRFHDSSDEEAVDLAPVRGIPRTIDEGDSTDLEDSSIEHVRAPNSGKSTETQPTTISSPSSKPGGAALSIGSLRTPKKSKPAVPAIDTSPPPVAEAEVEKKKHSFFGSLARKRKDEPSRSRKPASEALPTLFSKSKTEVSSPPNTNVADTSSPQGTPIKGVESTQASPKSPKLQRRVTPNARSSINGNTWPVDQQQKVTASDPPSRPRTSDGPATNNQSVRPDLGNRRITLQSAPDAEAIENAGKKKKRRFPMLRRALGLNK